MMAKILTSLADARAFAAGADAAHQARSPHSKTDIVVAETSHKSGAWRVVEEGRWSGRVVRVLAVVKPKETH